jgi:hypothetical protein
MSKWIVFYDNAGSELVAYTAADEFAGERKATAELLAYERDIPISVIIIKEEERLMKSNGEIF